MIARLDILTWEDIFNNENLSWVSSTNDIINVIGIEPEIDVAYKLHSSIFDCDKETFMSYVNYIGDIIGNPNRVAEFGDRNASTLYWLNKTYGIDVHGVDLSSSLIERCKRLLPDYKDQFYVSNSFIPMKDGSVDWFICNSVFQYLNRQQAIIVIEEMLRCSTHGIVISDVKNKKTETNFKIAQAKRQCLTIEGLAEKYKDTPLSFYDESFFDMLPDVKIIPMLGCYPDAEFESYTVVIRK